MDKGLFTFAFWAQVPGIYEFGPMPGQFFL